MDISVGEFSTNVNMCVEDIEKAVSEIKGRYSREVFELAASRLDNEPF
jgi:hypothetical protein